MGTILRSKLIWGLLVGLLLGPFVVPDGSTICNIEAVSPAFVDRLIWGAFIGLGVGLILDIFPAQDGKPVRRQVLVLMAFVLPMLVLKECGWLGSLFPFSLLSP